MNVLKSGFSVFLTRIWGALVGIIVSIVIARTLGPEGKGIYSLLLLVPTLLVTFGNAGIGMANVYFKGKKSANLSHLATNSLWSALVFGLMMIGLFGVSYPFISDRFFADIPASQLFSVVALVPFFLVNAYFANLLLAVKKVKLHNIAVTIQMTMLLLTILILILVFNIGTPALIAAITVNAVVGAFLMVGFLTNSTKISWRFQGSLFKDTIRYGLKGYFANAIQFLNYRLDILLVSFFISTAAVGWYSVAVNFAEVLWYVPTSLGAILFPHVANSSSKDANATTSRISRQTTLMMTLASIGVAIAAPWLIPKVFGPEFAPAITALLYLLPGVLLFSVAKILGNYFSGSGKVGLNGAVSASALVVNVVLNLILIPRMGITGAALASTISYSFATVLLVFFFVRDTSLTWSNLLVPNAADVKDLLAVAKLRNRETKT